MAGTTKRTLDEMKRLRQKVADLEEENRVLKGQIRKLKAAQPSKARHGGCC